MKRGARLVLRWGALGGLLAMGACESARSAQDPAVQAEARQIWQDRCANCHGPSGAGDGPQAPHLRVSPRRLSDAQWQSTVSDEQLRKVIVEGGPAVGLDVAMAPNPDLRARPAVVEALVEHVRGLRSGG